MNEKRRPQGKDHVRRADRFAERPAPVEEVEGQIEGRNALTEALKSGRTIDKVYRFPILIIRKIWRKK